MNVLYDLFHNTVFVTAGVAWAVAQVIKTIIDFYINGKLNLERMVGSGGMPSCHSATVSSLATISLLMYGAGSFEFAISAMLAIIVMYDARGVRRETGTQAVIINEIMDYLSNPLDSRYKDPEFSQEKLKEFIGHTPLQVICGAVLGILIALISYYGFVV
ncbi:MAG: divergent PAP2 family protein [Lachnospiraceae bacterium]|nr:divergent PAP2 family protein [Lachnospiraceae bacterium]